MTSQEVISWVKIEFLPLNIVTPEPTILQLLENSKRYWNTHSGYKIVRMYDFNNPESFLITLTPEVKNVVQVYPATTSSWIWHDHPLWTMLGMAILDNVTEDLILMSAAFQNYRIYVGTDFRYHYVRSDDPTIGGKLFLRNLPVKCERVCVVGTKRLLPGENIKSEYILDWILHYVKAQVKQVEGNSLRKSDVIGIHNDGQQLFDEGKTEVKDLQEQLSKDGRWVCMAKRF